LLALRDKHFGLVKDGDDYHVRHYKQHIVTYYKPEGNEQRVLINPYNSKATYDVLYHCAGLYTGTRLPSQMADKPRLVIARRQMLVFVNGYLDKSRSENGVWYTRVTSDEALDRRTSARVRFDNYVQMALLGAEPDPDVSPQAYGQRITWQTSRTREERVERLKYCLHGVQAIFDKDDEPSDAMVKDMMEHMRHLIAYDLAKDKTRTEALYACRKAVADAETTGKDLMKIGEEWPTELPRRVHTNSRTRESFLDLPNTCTE
jgi:hypothetical protein